MLFSFQEHCRRGPSDYPTMGTVAINLDYVQIVKPLNFENFTIFKVIMSDDSKVYVSLLEEEIYKDLPTIFKDI